MKYLVFESEDTEGPRTGIEHDGTIIDVTDQLSGKNDPFAELLASSVSKGWSPRAFLESAEGSRYDADALTIKAPLAKSGRLFCLGGAYTSHLEERNRDLFTVPEQWYVPRSSIVGPDSPIVLPKRIAGQVKPAAELGVVIGEGGRNIDDEKALDLVAGYTVSNDVTARTDWPGPRGYKIMDTFNPLGPAITPSTAINNPLDLDIRMYLDDDTICEGSTRGHRFTISFMISYMSTIIELRPGDILSTGDPGGVSGQLMAGRELITEIESVGTLRNPIVEQ